MSLGPFTEQPQHVVSMVDSKDLVFAVSMSDLYHMINSGNRVGLLYIDKNVCEEPLAKIAAFLGIPFQFSTNSISGGCINDSIFVVIKERMLVQFVGSCSLNGLSYLPAPLNTRVALNISIVTYLWLGFLRIPGLEPWSTCKSGVHILNTINGVGR